MDKIAVYVISEQLLFRRGLVSLVSSWAQYEVMEELSSCPDIKRMTTGLSNSLFIVDAEIPCAEISKLIGSFKNELCRIVLLGSVYNKKRILQLLSLKADGYFTTDVSENEFLLLLDKVLSGATIIADSLVPELVESMSANLTELEEEQKDAVLTPREKEILRLLATGSSNSQIAQKLVISIYTVKNHVHNILEKLGIDNRTKLVSYALTRGLVSGILMVFSVAAIYLFTRPCLPTC